MKYKMHGDEWEEPVYVDLVFTDKTVTITPISEKPVYMNKPIAELWDRGKIVVFTGPKMNKMCRHAWKDWGEGEYTLTVNRKGTPYLLVPERSADERTMGLH